MISVTLVMCILVTVLIVCLIMMIVSAIQNVKKHNKAFAMSQYFIGAIFSLICQAFVLTSVTTGYSGGTEINNIKSIKSSDNKTYEIELNDGKRYKTVNCTRGSKYRYVVGAKIYKKTAFNIKLYDISSIVVLGNRNTFD